MYDRVKSAIIYEGWWYFPPTSLGQGGIPGAPISLCGVSVVKTGGVPEWGPFSDRILASAVSLTNYIYMREVYTMYIYKFFFS